MENKEKLYSAAAGGIVGAGLMYFFDPRLGRRRRAELENQLSHAGHVAVKSTPKALVDIKQRAQGAWAETKNLILSDEIDDDVLVDRVRASLGRLTSHPGAIEVKAQGGNITLLGPALTREVDEIVEGVSNVRGVKSVEDKLERHKEPENVSGLQGGTYRDFRSELMKANWAPAIRLGAALTAVNLAAYGIRRKDLGGVALTLAGLGLGIRAVTNLPWKRLTGIGAGRRAVALQKTIHINAPLEKVYGIWANPNQFPELLAKVKEVRAGKENTSYWLVKGPFGIPMRWEAEVTNFRPNNFLSWKSKPGALIRHAGTAHFETEPNGTTRVHIQMHYNPPGGAVGHALACLFGADAKSELDDEMVRLKTYLETGKKARNAAA